MLTPLRTKLSDLVRVYAIRPKAAGASTTLAANAAAGATALTLTSATGFDGGDPVLVGTEEDREIHVQSGAPAGAVINVPAPGLMRAHVGTEAVREGVAYDLGNVVNVQDGSSADVADNETDISRNPDGRRLGHLMLMPQFDVQGMSPWLFALCSGMDLARVLGAGTQTDPHQLATDGTDFGAVDTGIVLAERLADGTFLQHWFDACSADYSQLALPMGQGRETLLAGRFIAANHGRRLVGAPGFTVDTTLRASKALQVEALLETGLFRVLSGGLSTTLTSAVAKDANVFPVASATGIAGGKWYRVSGGGVEQILWVQSLATLNVTVRSRAAYAFPAGSTFVELEQLPLGGLKEGTTEFRVGGSIRPVRFDNARVQAGARPGSALFTLSCQPVSRTLEMLRQRMGLPTAAISGSALYESDLAGTDAPVGWYTRAQRKDQQALYLVGAGCDNGLEQLAMAMTKADLASTTLTFRTQLLQALLYTP